MVNTIFPNICRIELNFLPSAAWVMGAADPTSGTVTLTEVVYGLGALLKSGWRPLRNIVIASWDAEEVSPELHILENI